MKDKIRQILVVLSILATIVVNTLANTLPINGKNTGVISDSFDVYFVPAGYVFSIWGLIYIGLIVFAIYQALHKQSDNPRLRAIGWWVFTGGLANIAWIFLWHYEKFPLTFVAMLVLLLTLVVTYLRLGIGKSSAQAIERWVVRLPFSIYLGWITVATVANATSLLDYLKWYRFGLSEMVWMGIMLAAVLVIAALMNFTRKDAAYALVLLWALAGIALKFASVPGVAIPTWITFGGVVITYFIATLIRRQKTA